MRPRSCPFEQAVSKRGLPRLGRCCHAARTQSGDPKMVVIPAPRSVRHCGTRELILPTSSQTAVSIDVIGCVGAVVEPGEVVLLERNNLSRVSGLCGGVELGEQGVWEYVEGVLVG